MVKERCNYCPWDIVRFLMLPIISSGQGFGLILFHSSRLWSVNRLDNLTYSKSPGDFIELICIFFSCTSYQLCIVTALKIYSDQRCATSKSPSNCAASSCALTHFLKCSSPHRCSIFYWSDERQIQQGSTSNQHEWQFCAYNYFMLG